LLNLRKGILRRAGNDFLRHNLFGILYIRHAQSFLMKLRI